MMQALIGREKTRWLVSERVLVTPGQPTEPLAIGIEGARVVALSSAASIRQARPETIWDFGDRLITPSFVNGHSHLAMAPLRGITSSGNRYGNVVSDVFFRVEQHLTEADVFAFTRLGAVESLLNGVGEVWDHYYYGEAVARALLEIGLSGTVAPTLQDEAGPFSRHFEREFEATLRIHENSVFEGAGIFAAFGPHAADTVSDALFERVAEAGRRLQVPVHLHLAQAASEMEKARDGRVSERVRALLRGNRVLLAHGLFLSREEIASLVSDEWVLAFCPLSQIQFGFLGPLLAWGEAGGQVVVGTDCVASNDALSVQRELPWLAAQSSLAVSFGAARGALLQQAGRAAVRAIEEERSRTIQSLWIEGDSLLQVGLGAGLWPSPTRPRGRIQVGTLANFQVLDVDAPEFFPGGDWSRRLAYGETSGAIHALVVAGQLKGEPGNFRASLLESAHYREVRQEAERRLGELFERAGLRSRVTPRPL